jgi:phosphoglycolate phosphatase-like HAD superfamily hydrolase
MVPADPGVRAPRFPLIVFDWDGTLVDSTALIVASIREACRAIGAAVPDEDRARHVIGLGLYDALHHVVPDVPPARYPELSARYREHFVARDAEIPLFAGMRDLLVELEGRGHLLAIATGKSRHGLERALEQQQIGHHFAATRCADEGFAKPHPDMLLHPAGANGCAGGRGADDRRHHPRPPTCAQCGHGGRGRHLRRPPADRSVAAGAPRHRRLRRRASRLARGPRLTGLGR